jgi:hypothetical protein
MEKIMTHTTKENELTGQRKLTEQELDSVTGGATMVEYSFIETTVLIIASAINKLYS